jgi:hypothetical protein
VLRVGRPWTPGAKYAVSLRALRNVTGVTGEAVGTLVVPERQAADSTKAAGDSLRAKADSQPGRPKGKPGQRGAPKPRPKLQKPAAPSSP